MNSRTIAKQIDILLVDDSEGDVRLARETLKESKLINNVFDVSDGEQAMAFLKKQGKYSNAPRPDLILLDLNMPRKDGREVLADIKADQDLRRIPVVILTVSSDEADILATYNLYANCYVTKPIDLGQFVKVVKSIEDFWLSIVKLPSDGTL